MIYVLQGHQPCTCVSAHAFTLMTERSCGAQAVASWPPASQGSKAIARKWWGSLHGRTLVLVRQSTLDAADRVPVVEVDLAGCS